MLKDPAINNVVVTLLIPYVAHAFIVKLKAKRQTLKGMVHHHHPLNSLANDPRMTYEERIGNWE